MKYYAIIVAGGSGKRMQNVVAKQFLILKDKPIMMHTLSAFYCSIFKPELIVVLPNDLHAQWEELCVAYNFSLPHRLVDGGEQRFHSVRNGLLTIKGEGIVAIHDAVRPLVSSNLIQKTYEAAIQAGNAITCIKPSDSVRKIKLNGSEILNRDEIVLIQTPQAFDINQLRKGYRQPYQSEFTDDASVVERAGFNVNLIEGERNNLKITYPEDLDLANLLC